MGEPPVTDFFKVAQLSLILILLLGALFRCGYQKKILNIGDPAPDFTLENTKGEEVSLEELMNGKELIINFWATWCPSCVKEMPQLEKFSKVYADRVVIIGINVGETKEKVTAFAQQLGVTYPILLDSESEVVKFYGIGILPANVVVNKDGLIKDLNLDIRGMESYLKQIK